MPISSSRTTHHLISENSTARSATSEFPARLCPHSAPARPPNVHGRDYPTTSSAQWPVTSAMLSITTTRWMMPRLLDGCLPQSSKNEARIGLSPKMRFRFYRRIPLIPGLLWLNLSKCGFSFSVGKRGWRLTRNRHGFLFTLGLTGSGMFWSKFISHGKVTETMQDELFKDRLVSKKEKLTYGKERK